MAQINFLPWREKKREKRKKEFLGFLAFAMVIGFLMVFMGGFYVKEMIKNQQVRNNYLEVEIDKLKIQIASINKLKAKKNDLLKRVEAINYLQKQRFAVIHILNEITNAVPSDVYLTSFNLINNQIDLQGVAKKNDNISNFMRRLNASKWFQQVNLGSVSREKSTYNDHKVSVFDLKFVSQNLGENTEGKS